MKVAGYVRLSRDEDKENYSSILSQKSIIEEYAKQHDWAVCRYYEDDNCSGYTFDRPAICELIRDLENNRIDIIIAKDLSRIGRHNAYTLLFVDKIKYLNKRLILPKEGRGYDTADNENDLLGITTWFNEMYVKDISRKIRSSINAKQKEGRFIIREVFGYQKCSEDKHKLEIDIEAASIVQKIYCLYLSGIGYRKIADMMNLEHYPTPSQYNANKSTKPVKGTKTAVQWNSAQVQRILKNDVYTGTLRLAKTEKISIKGKSRRKPENKQYIFENNHPAIISREMFDEVQKISQGRQKNHSKGAASLQNLFSGLVKCQDCGSYMIAYNKEGKSKSYICGKYHKYGRKGCERHSIKEDMLLEAVSECIRLMASSFEGEIAQMQFPVNSSNLDEEHILIKKLKMEHKQCKEQLKLLIMQKISELKKDNCKEYQSITQESFYELEDNLKRKLMYLEARINQLRQKQPYTDGIKETRPGIILREITERLQLKRKDMEILIDKILIDCGGNSTIYMKINFEALCTHIPEGVNLVRDL